MKSRSTSVIVAANRAVEQGNQPVLDCQPCQTCLTPLTFNDDEPWHEREIQHCLIFV